MSRKLLQLLTPLELQAVTSQVPRRSGARVTVGLSGGVDSSVTAAILASFDHLDVSACWMRNWDIHEESPSHVPVCSQEKDLEDATRVAKRLGLDLREVDLSREYWCSVWDPCVQSYNRGTTPNPDTSCNREIKFGVLLDHVLDGDSILATGHYARLDQNQRLVRGLDRSKDQSYFLSTVLPSSFRRACFPVGGLLKSRTKEIARAVGFGHIAARPESQGVCFIGERGQRFSNFLSDYIDGVPGNFVNLQGKVLGQHSGSSFFTIGQRARVPGLEEPYYVAQKQGNDLVIVPGNSHPALYSRHLVARFERQLFDQSQMHQHLGSHQLLGQIRHRSEAKPLSLISMLDSNETHVDVSMSFHQPEQAVASGQVIALYLGERVLGGGEIVDVTNPIL